jgi:hypothetical protein
MNFSKADLTELKLSLVALTIAIALSSVLLSLSGKYLEHSIKDRQAAQSQLTESRSQLLATQNDRDNMSAYALEYTALLDQKVIGNEQRLDWMEGLERLRKQGAVLDFKYTIAPQQSYAPNPPLDAGNFLLSRSSMTLQIDLLHEEQLLHLLTDMRKELNGWFMLDGCTLTKTGTTDDITPLKASCSGGWFTMKPKGAP